MAPPNRRRSILKSKNNEDETENFRGDPEESQWANVTQSARKRVSFSAKNHIKEFVKNCSSDNSNLSSDMDMTVCKERSMHEQNGDFGEELENSAMDMTTHPAVAMSESPEPKTANNSSHVFITPAVKGTALSKSSVSFVTSTPASRSSPKLVTPQAMKMQKVEAAKITPISHPPPAEHSSIEKGRIPANQSVGRGNMSVTSLSSTTSDHTVFRSTDMSIIQEGSLGNLEEARVNMFERSAMRKTMFEPVDMSYEDQTDGGNAAVEYQQNSRRKTTFQPADMSYCEEQNFGSEHTQYQHNARRKTTFEPADMSCCEEPSSVENDVLQQQSIARRKTRFEPVNMSYCEDAVDAVHGAEPQQNAARRKTTFEPADMSCCDEQLHDGDKVVVEQKNARRKTTFEPHDMSYEEPAHTDSDFVQPQKHTSEMSMTFVHGTHRHADKLRPQASESERTPPSVSNTTRIYSHSGPEMSMTRILPNETMSHCRGDGPSAAADEEPANRTKVQCQESIGYSAWTQSKNHTQMSMTAAQLDVPELGPSEIVASTEEEAHQDNPADLTRQYDMSMEISFGEEPGMLEQPPPPQQISNYMDQYEATSVTNRSMARTIDAKHNESNLAPVANSRANCIEELPETANCTAAPPQVQPGSPPKSSVNSRGPTLRTTSKKPGFSRQAPQSFGWHSDPAFAPKIYSKSSLATAAGPATANAAAPSVPSVSQFGRFGCAKTPKRLIPVDVLSGGFLVAPNESNAPSARSQEAVGTPQSAEKKSSRRPQKRTIEPPAGVIEAAQFKAVPPPATNAASLTSVVSKNKPSEVPSEAPNTTHTKPTVEGCKTQEPQAHVNVDVRENVAEKSNQANHKFEASILNVQSSSVPNKSSSISNACLPPSSIDGSMNVSVAKVGQSSSAPKIDTNKSVSLADIIPQPKPVKHKPSPILPPVGFVEPESPKAPPAKKPALAMTSMMQVRPDTEEPLATAAHYTDFSRGHKPKKAMNSTYVLDRTLDGRNGPSTSKPVVTVNMPAPRPSPMNATHIIQPGKMSSPDAGISPMNKTTLEASIALPPSKRMEWDTTCGLGTLKSEKSTGNPAGILTVEEPSINETFVVEPEEEIHHETVFETSRVSEDPENEEIELQPVNVEDQPANSLRKTFEELHLSQGVAATDVLQKTLGELNLTHGRVQKNPERKPVVVNPDIRAQAVPATDLPASAELRRAQDLIPPKAASAQLDGTRIILQRNPGQDENPTTSVAVVEHIDENEMNESLIIHRSAVGGRANNDEQMLEDMEKPEDLSQDLSFGSSDFNPGLSFAAPRRSKQVPGLAAIQISPINPAPADQSLFQSSVMDSPTSPQQPLFSLPPAQAVPPPPTAPVYASVTTARSRNFNEPSPLFPPEIRDLLRIMMNTRGARKMRAAQKLWRNPDCPLHLQADLYELLKQYLPPLFCSQDWRY